MNHHITNANIKEWARDYDGPQFDGILCDPPYELGFMGKSWDSSGIAFDQDMWADLLRILKPGGHLLAFSGSRTYHRMAVAIEDAGFEIRDMIEWVYGSGFPKSLNIGKAVDKINGRFYDKGFQDYCNERRINKGYSHNDVNKLMDTATTGGGFSSSIMGNKIQNELPTLEMYTKLKPILGLDDRYDELIATTEAKRDVIGTKTAGIGSGKTYAFTDENDKSSKTIDITAPATEEAKQYEGYGTALKPAHEPCVLARKPMIDPDIDLTETVRRAIIDTGLTEEIQWNNVSVTDVEKSRQLTYLSSTHLLRTAETYVKRVKSKQTTDTESDTENHYAKEQKNGTENDQTTTSSTEKSLPSDLKTKSLTPTVTSANVAESQSEHSLHLTTSTVVVDSTEKPTTAKYIQSLGDKGFLLATELFAGTVTGLTDLATPVLIARNSDGTYTYPKELPRVIKGGSNTVANNVLKHGTGGLNIDGTRVGTVPRTTHKDGNKRTTGLNPYHGANELELSEITAGASGRFPANLIHDGSDEVEAVFPQTKSGKIEPHHRKSNVYGGNSLLSSKTINNSIASFGDSGSASRFFYTAKASKSERNAGLDGFEEQVGERTMGKDSRERPTPTNSNHHPTVKPLSLTKYLATLIKPPTGGRLLVPFSGSGSEMIGALQAGWEYVEGVELTEDYIPIAEARIKHWLEQKAEEDNKPKQESLL